MPPNSVEVSHGWTYRLLTHDRGALGFTAEVVILSNPLDEPVGQVVGGLDEVFRTRELAEIGARHLAWWWIATVTDGL